MEKREGRFEQKALCFYYIEIDNYRYRRIMSETNNYIELAGMEFFSYHGHFDEEQIVGNRFVVDLRVNADFSRAGVSDDLFDTVDYQGLYAIVAEEMAIPSKLLESVAKRIIERLKKRYPQVTGATLSISKLNPSLGGQVGAAKIVLSY